jgi:hypothetical protein
MLIFDQAQTICQTITSDSSAASLSFFNTMMNVGYKYALADLARAVTEKTKTGVTVASQQYYQMPPDFLWIKDITITIGSTIYPIVEIVDQEEWDYLNAIVQNSDLPSFFFVRPYFGVGGAEIGIYPVPSSSGNTITIVYESSDHDLTAAAYTTGTVAVTNGSAAVVGTATAFTANMVGRYFQIADPNGDGLWYQVAARADNSDITLINYYAGATGSGLGYSISEAFALPEEMQILPVYYALWHYYAMKENEKQMANYKQLFDLGLAQGKLRYGTKSRSNVIRNKPWWMGQSGNQYPAQFPQGGITH